MKKRRISNLVLGSFVLMICLAGWLGFAPAVQASPLAQQPTVAIPTVTGTPSGPVITVNADQDQINVRSGPNTDYPIVGVLVAGQKVPALGRSVGGDWVQIVYPGVEGGVAWVYAYLVTSNSTLPIVEPPPTPTPRVTPTIDPTLASQYVINLEPTRLPTYTAPPPLAIPTYTEEPVAINTGGLPMGLIIVGMGVVGIFGLLISLFQRR
ncbi:MAG TPA: SH3 domain-containing protein [Anaerolineales bacterium]|nr:SH3 domain-containing protein [Anaerolineales bacterium]